MLTSRLISLVTAICLVPPTLQWFGFDFSTSQYRAAPHWLTVAAESNDGLEVEALFLARGVIVHSLTEWTAVCLAFFTAVLSFVHYFLKKDVTTPVIATALMFAALLDAFRVLAMDHLIIEVSDPVAFTRITWALSRVFLITLLVSGTLPFLVRRSNEQRVARDFRDFALLLVAYSLAAFLIIYYSGRWLQFSDDAAITDHLTELLNFTALLLFSIAGGLVLTLYCSRYGGVFATAMVASLIPHSAAQLYATFGSSELYDAGFNLASFYKLVGYLVPLVGLVLDYRRASRADAELATTARQLDIARDIQTSLLPRELPKVARIDVAGYSVASEAVGGDYYDHITLPDGSLMLVVADVSGHDLGAALLMANARAYLKAWAEDESDIAAILESLNRFVAHDAMGRRFITGMLARVPSEGDIQFVCAGHTGYVVRPDGTYRTLEQKNVPLGVFDDLQADTAATQLADNETLLLLTDGVIELPNPTGNQLGLERIAKVVSESTDASAAETLDSLRTTASQWAGKVAPFDDMTALLLKRR